MAQHPTEEILNITRKFLGGEVKGGEGGDSASIGSISPYVPPTGTAPARFPGRRGLPSQAASIAGSRAFGQRGVQQRRGGGDLIQPLITGPYVPPTDVAPDRTGSLAENFFNLPGPVGFAKTPQGRAILQRILGGFRGGGLR